jgi:squalene-associated FAD-dependent desaturase
LTFPMGFKEADRHFRLDPLSQLGFSEPMTSVHIIGTGMAGLSCAVALMEAGRSVVLYESGPAAGGRCRSFFDQGLGCRIDNGNHLLLSGNRATFAYLRLIGAESSLVGPDRPLFPFRDLATGRRWIVQPNLGRIPWWLLVPGRCPPETTWGEIAALMRFVCTGGDSTTAATVSEAFRRHGGLYQKLIAPLAIAALNTAPEEASADLFRAVLRQSLGGGGRACLPRMPRVGLSESFVDPALAWLRARGGVLHLGCRVTGLAVAADRVTAIVMAQDVPPVPISEDETVVLAAPAPVAAKLLPGLCTPTAFESILNLHYRAALPTSPGFLGLVGGTAEWVFARGGLVSVTISAANRLLDRNPEVLAATVWGELARLFGVAEALPPFRVVWEKRATFLASPAQDRLRPPAQTVLRNLVLAGDWTATGLPSTIEGAIRSGRTAADYVLGTPSNRV